MPTRKHRKIVAIAGEIDRYLEKHPNSADSLTGVARWWLTRQRYEDALEDIQAALEYLETQQAIFKQVNSDGTIIYRSFSPTSEEKH
jgi:hypothetical protein